MLRSTSLRVLRPEDLDAVTEVLSVDPVADVFVASRVQAVGLDPARLGGEMWGYAVDGRLTALCHAGANLVPVQATSEAIRAFAERARRQGRRCSSIVGPAPAVLELWRLLLPYWGPAREVREIQPLMSIDRPPRIQPDPEVRLVQPDEIDVLMPACIEMFTEEVGVSPLVGDGGSLYRARVEELVATGRAFARIEDGVVVFKAEIGAATTAACQVQGVWVHPPLRRRGVGAAGMAAVVQGAQESVAPVVSLYVNDFNVAARRSYKKVGFQEIGTFASVLF